MGSSSMGQARAAGHPTPLLPLPFFDAAYEGRTSILVQPLVSYANNVPPARCPEHTWARETTTQTTSLSHPGTARHRETISSTPAPLSVWAALPQPSADALPAH